MAGNVKKYQRDKGYEPIRREMLQDEDNLSIEAMGLLCNLTSYPDTWEVHKTQLYRRFAKNGRRKIENAWNELVDERYIVQLRRRNGKLWEYIYYHSQVRFTNDEIREIEEKEGCLVWDGKMSNSNKETVDSGKVDKYKISTDVTDVQSNVSSTEITDNRTTNKENYYQEKDNTLDTIIDTGVQTYPQEDEYFKNAFLNNVNKIPERLSRCLYVLGKGESYANHLYKIILNAKRGAVKLIGRMVNFEDISDDIYVEDLMISVVSRVMYKNKMDKLKNVDNYLYQSVKNALIDRLKVGYDMSDNQFEVLWE